MAVEFSLYAVVKRRYLLVNISYSHPTPLNLVRGVACLNVHFNCDLMWYILLHGTAGEVGVRLCILLACPWPGGLCFAREVWKWGRENHPPHDVTAVCLLPDTRVIIFCPSPLFCVIAGFVQNLMEPLKDGRVRLFLNAGDHANMQESLKKCLKKMGVAFQASRPERRFHRPHRVSFFQEATRCFSAS